MWLHVGLCRSLSTFVHLCQFLLIFSFSLKVNQSERVYVQHWLDNQLLKELVQEVKRCLWLSGFSDFMLVTWKSTAELYLLHIWNHEVEIIFLTSHLKTSDSKITARIIRFSR